MWDRCQVTCTSYEVLFYKHTKVFRKCLFWHLASLRLEEKNPSKSALQHIPCSRFLWKTLRSMGWAKLRSKMPRSAPVTLLATWMLCVCQSDQYMVSAKIVSPKGCWRSRPITVCLGQRKKSWLCGQKKKLQAKMKHCQKSGPKDCQSKWCCGSLGNTEASGVVSHGSLDWWRW